MSSLRRNIVLLVLVVAALACFVACSITVESGELTGIRHHHEEEDSDTPTPWPTPTPTVKG